MVLNKYYNWQKKKKKTIPELLEETACSLLQDLSEASSSTSTRSLLLQLSSKWAHTKSVQPHKRDENKETMAQNPNTIKQPLQAGIAYDGTPTGSIMSTINSPHSIFIQNLVSLEDTLLKEALRYEML